MKVTKKSISRDNEQLIVPRTTNCKALMNNNNNNKQKILDIKYTYFNLATMDKLTGASATYQIIKNNNA